MTEDKLRKLYFSQIWVSSKGALFFVVRVVQLVMLGISRILMPIFWAKIQVHSRANVNPKTPLLILANHKSYYDPLVVCNALSMARLNVFPLRFFSKDKLFFHWYSSWFYALSGAFPAFYKQGLEKSLAVPKQILKNGGVVMMFPEGGCIREDVLGEFKVGASVLAKEVGELYILPMAIHQSYKIKWRFLFGLPEVKVKVGEVFSFKDEVLTDDVSEINQEFKKRISILFEDVKNSQ